MSGSLEGKIALGTGGGSCLGRAGARVIVADVDAADGAETVHRVAAAGSEAHFILTDVAPAAAVEALIHKTVAVYSRLDCAFNNAGVSSPQVIAAHPLG